MLKRTLVALALLCGLISAVPASAMPAGTPQARAQVLAPPGLKLVLADDFQTLDERTGGPSEWGLDDGTGTWSTAPYYGDAKGSDGLSVEFWKRNGFLCGGVNYDRISVAGGYLKIDVLPTPAACTSAGISKPYLSGLIHTGNSLLIKGEFFACASAQMTGTVGTVPAPLWSITRPPGHLDGYRARFEADGGELAGAGVTSSTTTTTAAILGDDDNVAGGTYNNSPGNVTHQTVLPAGFHTYCQWVKQDRVRFYLDGRLIRDVTASGTWFAQDRWHYILIDLGLDDGTLFGAGNTYAGGAAQIRVDWVKVWAPSSFVAGKDYIDRRAGDGEGAGLMNDPPSASVFTDNCFWYDQSTTTTVGTALNEPDEIKPAVVPSNGAVWHGREGGCNSPAGVTGGITYHATFAFNYGTSGSFGAYLMLSCTGHNDVNITVTGDVATLASGTASNIRVVTNPLGFKELKFDWDPGCAGNWTTRGTPNSATAGQDVLFYRMKLRQ